jgi:hypothetical protein
MEERLGGVWFRVSLDILSPFWFLMVLFLVPGCGMPKVQKTSPSRRIDGQACFAFFELFELFFQ